MEITGRLTANATINETKNGAKVVNFCVAVNDRFKAKSGELKEHTSYFNCAYWISTGIAEHLCKGILVEASGKVSADAWVNADGKAKASLRFHVDRIKLHGKGNSTSASETKTAAAPEEMPF